MPFYLRGLIFENVNPVLLESAPHPLSVVPPIVITED